MSRTAALLLLLSTAVARAAVPDPEVELGQALFNDTNLSEDRSVACATCHQEEHAFTDTRSSSIGVGHRRGNRNAPTLIDIEVYRALFWDGRAKTLDEQAAFPFLNPNELGFHNLSEVLQRIGERPGYLETFDSVRGCALKGHTGRCGAKIQFSDVARALAAYEKSLTEPPTPLDRYLSGEKAALSAEQLDGLRVFQGKGHCADCHVVTASAAPLTDNEYHDSNVGLRSVGKAIPSIAATLTGEPPEERYQELTLDSGVAALGRYVVTLDPRDLGKFRTPSLRRVSDTAPYMHDGSVPTLEEALDIEVYYRGVESGRPAVLSPDERRHLLQLLQSL